jgi:hypothetical protein
VALKFFRLLASAGETIRTRLNHATKGLDWLYDWVTENESNARRAVQVRRPVHQRTLRHRACENLTALGEVCESSWDCQDDAKRKPQDEELRCVRSRFDARHPVGPPVVHMNRQKPDHRLKN